MAHSTDIDDALERDYNARAARTDYDQILEAWNQRSQAFRRHADGVLDIACGSAERQRVDIFTAGRDGPTLVYLHGGYWQRGDKSAYGFVAEPFVNHGVNVVLMGYTLCPDISVPGIVEEIRQGLAWLFRNSREYGLSPERINVTGHSAGGHLTAMMMATDWPGWQSGLPADLVKTGIPISGLYDLAPLRHTTINQAARIDDDVAGACSPLFLEPACRAPILAVVGGAESGAFHEQANRFVERWAHSPATLYVEPGVDHFDIVNRLADPGSVLFRKTLALLA